MKCANCKETLYPEDTQGNSSIYGSHDVSNLCEPCWLDEDEMIDAEGTNSPEFSETVKRRLEHYRGEKK